MKPGDLVTYADVSLLDGRPKEIGLVVATGVWVGNCDVLVLWGWHGDPITQKSRKLEVINENR